MVALAKSGAVGAELPQFLVNRERVEVWFGGEFWNWREVELNEFYKAA